MLPSSGKISNPKYEYVFVKSEGEQGKPITCQVKNQAKIEESDYNDDKEVYEKIYLFSGCTQNAKTEYDNIKFISNEELYNTLLNFLYLKNKLSKYYIIPSDIQEQYESKNVCNEIIEVLNKNGWHKGVKYNKDNTAYKTNVDDENFNIISNESYENDSSSKWQGIEFYNNIFFSEDFNGIIVTEKNERISTIIEKLEKIFILKKYEVK